MLPGKLFPRLFPDCKTGTQIGCGRTKATAIVQNVLGPFSQQQLTEELHGMYFSVSSNASNVGNTKTYPYTVQYLGVDGICQKLLDFYEDPNECSADIFQRLKEITEFNGLKLEHISAYSVDNASVNYGRHNSVYQKLADVNKRIIKANCKCHMLNNCIKNANKVLLFDVECLVIEVYNEFSSSAKKSA